MLRIHKLTANQSEFIQAVYKPARIKNYGEKIIYLMLHYFIALGKTESIGLQSDLGRRCAVSLDFLLPTELSCK